MAYKKYIMRNGKLYGPYLYESRRVNGKVVSEYHGMDKKPVNIRKFVFMILGVLLLAGFVYGVVYSKNRITSNVIIDTRADYKRGEILNGFFEISLSEGELIPADSEVIFENSGNKYKYDLSDIIPDETVNGIFYLKENQISGSGEGYGIKGKKLIYPAVWFTMRIYSADETQPAEETAEEAGNESSSETPKETEENTSITEPVAEEIPETTEPIPETKIPENTEAPITGGAVSNVFTRFFNFFQGMITGGATSNLNSVSEVSGEVYSDKPFTYNLEPGQKAEIISSTQKVDLKIENNLAVVTTNYSEEQLGFGEDYTGENNRVISIDLSKLNLSFEKGELKTTLMYDNKEILSSSAVLEEDAADIKEIKEVEAENFTVNNFNNLTEEERAILNEKFADYSVKQTARTFKDRIIIRYELKDKWAEFSYNANISEEELRVLAERDRIKWLKDIAQSLRNNETPSEELNGFESDYGI